MIVNAVFRDPKTAPASGGLPENTKDVTAGARDVDSAVAAINAMLSV